MDTGPDDEARRWNDHRYKFNTKKRFGRQLRTKLERSFNKYGFDAHQYDVVEVVASVDELVIREEHWIEHYGSTGRNGLNILPSARGFRLDMIEDENVREHLREVRRQSSLTANKIRWNGLDDEQRRDRCRSMHTPAANMKRSNTVKDTWLDEKVSNQRKRSMRNAWASKTTEEKKRSRKRGSLFSNKKYIAISPDNTRYVIDDMISFSNQYGLHPATMRAVARGVHKSHRGWKCEPYVE